MPKGDIIDNMKNEMEKMLLDVRVQEPSILQAVAHSAAIGTEVEHRPDDIMSNVFQRMDIATLKKVHAAVVGTNIAHKYKITKQLMFGADCIAIKRMRDAVEAVDGHLLETVKMAFISEFGSENGGQVSWTQVSTKLCSFIGQKERAEGAAQNAA